MSDYCSSQYDSSRVATAGQNDNNSQPSDQLDPDGFSSPHERSRDVSGYAQPMKQESDSPDLYMNNVPQSHNFMHPRSQMMNIDQSGMMHFGTIDQDSQVQFSSADPYEFVPSNAMSSTAMSQDMLLDPGAGLFGRANLQSMMSPQGINMHQPQQSGHGLALLNTHMNNQSSLYNIASPVSSNQSPMLQDFPQHMSMNNQYLKQNSRNLPNMMNSIHNSLVNFGLNQQGPLTQWPRCASQQTFPLQQSAHSPRIQQLQSPRRQSVQLDQEQQCNPSQSQSIKHEDRRHSMPSAHQIFDPSQLRLPLDRRLGDKGGQTTQALNTNLSQSDQAFSSSTSASQHVQAPGSHYPNAYSSNGFDMMTVLMRVATRRNPQINLGAVDLSCAFTVCDVSRHDVPIVHCSENFERMTGYSRHDILGRNCRFLQAPDGRVQAGLKRQYVDDGTVLKLKNMIMLRAEVQVSLINYRKGGQPFMNLLTLIPIPLDSDDIKYYVGFQVDLVEQPHSVHSRNQDGSYQVSYQRGLYMPRYISESSSASQHQLESSQIVSRNDVSTVLTTIANGESDLSKRIWDKALLENTDDVVFVLSLKGLFLYLSPSSNRVLEYEAGDLLGTPLSSVAHPSDIVPIMRELKEASASVSIDVVFRFRRKTSGYMWFEGYGSLHADQVKGRKSVVLVGRERPVYTLSKEVLLSAGGIGDNEIWSKLSTSGMFLFVAGNARQLLDRLPSELHGTSIQAIMRSGSCPDFACILDIAKTGKRAQCKHDIINKRGQVLQAFSTLYPGDAAEGAKPTFVIAQTRILKYTRPSGTSYRSQNQVSKLERPSPDQSGAPSGASNEIPHPNPPIRRESSTFGSASPHQTASSASPASPYHFMSIFEPAATNSGQHGLRLGHQDIALAAEENLFEELKTTRSTSWQFELRQIEKSNRFLAEEMGNLLAARKKRKRRKNGASERDCSNCHAKSTPEWRRGPSGARDLCNSCGLRWAKEQGRISPRTTKSNASGCSGSAAGSASASPVSGVGSHMSLCRDATGVRAERFNAVDAERISERERRRSIDAASASRRPSASGAEDKGAHKVAKRERPDESPLPLGQSDDAIMGDRQGDADTGSDEEAESPFRHSGRPNAGTVLDDSILENTEGERQAETGGGGYGCW